MASQKNPYLRRKSSLKLSEINANLDHKSKLIRSTDFLFFFFLLLLNVWRVMELYEIY